MKTAATLRTPKFSPKPIRKPIKVVFATSDSPNPKTPRGPVKV
jgi:hypothetical protein